MKIRKISWVVARFCMTFAALGAAAWCAWAVVSGYDSEAWAGLAVATGYIAFIERLLSSRIILADGEVSVVNPVFTYRIPASQIRDVQVSGGGALGLKTLQGKEISPFAFSGSLIDAFFKRSHRAADAILRFLRKRQRGAPSKGISRSISRSRFGDSCALCCLISILAFGIYR